MIYFPLSRWDDSDEFPVIPGTADLQEGMYLTKMIDTVTGDNRMKVFSPLGENTEQFAGISIAQRRSDTTETVVEEITFPALASEATTVAASLSAAPINPMTDVMVVSTTGGLEMVLGDANLGAVTANTGGWFNATGNVITAYEGWAGLTALVTYRKSVSADYYYKQFGDSYQGLLAQDITQTIGVMTRGVGFTSFFYTGDYWESYTGASVLKVAAGGILTMASGATGAIVNGNLEAAPTVDCPWLGVRFSTY
jgi:hypothetical protein